SHASGSAVATVSGSLPARDTSVEASPDVAAPEPVAVVPREPLPAPWAPAPPLKERAAPQPEVSAHTAVIIDEASNTVLFDKDVHVALAPASLTKIAT